MQILLDPQGRVVQMGVNLGNHIGGALVNDVNPDDLIWRFEFAAPRAVNLETLLDELRAIAPRVSSCWLDTDTDPNAARAVNVLAYGLMEAELNALAGS